MATHRKKDPHSKSQSSNLWYADKQQSNKLFDASTKDLNIRHGIQPATSSPFASGLERSHWPSTRNVPEKATTGISFSGKGFKPSEKVKSRTPWTLRSLLEKNSRMSAIKPEESSRSASLAKSGSSICRNRRNTIVVVCLIVALCAIAIAIAIVFLRKASNSVTTSTTSTTTASTSTITTTSTTTTTKIPPATAWIPSNYNTSCSNTCINVSTVTPSTLLALWTFDLQTKDLSGNGNDGQVINGVPFTPISFTTGYIGQAIILRSVNAQYVNAPYINFVNRSFTVEAWIYLNSLSPGDLSIFGECETLVTDEFLHYVVRSNQLYMGFGNDGVNGATSLTTFVWYHVAFVYDYSLNIKYVYLNGLLDGISSSFSGYLGTSGYVTIGTSQFSTSAYWNGLLDQMTVTNRVKTSCEILNDASLIAHFSFDNNYNDVGPNSMIGTYNSQGNSGLSFISGQVNQALKFNSSNSYFESCGFYALGQNQPYSIAMWVKPSYQSGTLFHLSSSATGSGSWCLPMIGFSSNGSIVVQTWQGSAVSIMGPIPPINTWTHIVQTYSSTNGLQLYINGGLYGSATVNTFSSSSSTMCILLASSGLGTNCATGLISIGSYSGAIDEFYVYNRELNALEVCPLAHP